jgi:sigma-B regulation protein RsbU (phosphoserine phosphatase)
MTRFIMAEKFKNGYSVELEKIFRQRINLFACISIGALVLELFLGYLFFKDILSKDDMPGIVGGISVSAALLVTGRFAKTLGRQKARGFFISILLMSIAVLAAAAHPDIMAHLGITLVLIVLFFSALLLPWGAAEALAIGGLAVILFMTITRFTGTFVNNEVYAINATLLAVAGVVCAIVKKGETVMRQTDFAMRMEIEEKNAIMMRELELASTIHRGLIPKSMTSESVDIAVTYKPMLYIGGDYAKFHFLDKDRLFFIISDVTGHGVSAALLVNRVHTETESLIRQELPPGEVLKRLDRFITSDFGKMGIFLSAFCGMLDIKNKTLVYSNYGHPPQILFQRGNKSIVLMKSQTFLMGVGMDSGDIHQIKVSFNKGDRIFLFTDGIIEAKAPSGEEFGEERLEAFIRDNAEADVVSLNTRLISELSAFQHDKQHDDMFMLSIEIK